MPAALTQDTNKVIVGREIAISGTGFANSTAVTCTVTGPRGEKFVASITSSAGGALTGPTFVITQEGPWRVACTDGTNSATLTFIAWHSG